MREITDRGYRSIVIALAGGAHALAFFQFERMAPALAIPQRWHGQIIFLLAASLAASLLLALLRRKEAVWGLLCLKAVFLLAVGLPLGRNLTVEFSLISSIILETMEYAPLPSSTIFATALAAAVVLFQRPVSISAEASAAVTSFDLTAFCLYVVVLIATCSFARLFRDRRQVERQRRRRLDESTLQLIRTNMELQDFAALSEQRAVEGERKRLARDVHDALGYTLTNLIMMLEAALDLAGGSDVKLQSHLERARDQAMAGLLEVRRTLQAIREIEMPGEVGLKAVYRLVKAFDQATQLKIALHLGDAPWSLGQERDQVVYRFVQEGISNALRHGNATEISILFSTRAGGVEVMVIDNGIGFDEVAEGIGLTGMRERVQQVGGRLDIRSRPDAGTRLSAWIPFPEGG